MKHQEWRGIGRRHGQVGITALFVGLNVSRSGQNYMYIRIEIYILLSAHYLTASSTLMKAERYQLTQKNICYTAKPLHPPAPIRLAENGRHRLTRAEVLLTAPLLVGFGSHSYILYYSHRQPLGVVLPQL